MNLGVQKKARLGALKFLKPALVIGSFCSRAKWRKELTSAPLDMSTKPEWVPG